MRLTNPDYFTPEDAKNAVAMMQHTTELEKQASEGTTYIDCFRKTDARRTEIVMMVFAMQLLSGENLIGQGVQFLVQAGISTQLAFDLNMVLTAQFVSVHDVEYELQSSETIHGLTTPANASLLCFPVPPSSLTPRS
jgi:SP family general alpha glucoside:H+ symporter-like MFS transporter